MINTDSLRTRLDTFVASLSAGKVSRNIVTCNKEGSKWIVRLNGEIIDEFYRWNSAQKLVKRLEDALKSNG